MDERTWDDYATRLADMARTLPAQDSVQGTLDQRVRYAVAP